MNTQGPPPGANVLLSLSKFRLGRMLLWIAAVWLGLMALVPGPGQKALVTAALFPAVLAVSGSWNAWWAERESPRPGTMAWLLPRLMLGAVLLGGAALLLWWRRRRDVKVPLPPAPSPEDVDRWALAELNADTSPRERVA
ncbi:MULTISPECIES: hypothetical protein [unclassified Myxococcus]|uniref:hypothetical protein n=1 Tax=unclassified Myxococcus TaxID=2648731 RepID=UPI00157B8FF7|nr:MULTISPECIES: hypothetical protein [unclassified Myxococcus]NTX34627.1 hypothetical protein [Myxococcus sp. CA033]NTX49890.1 hypothetical protein [Myxococcus sp. CA039A]